MKIGDTFWEVNNCHSVAYCYPRKVISENHIKYYDDRYGVLTFPNEQQAKKRVEEINKESGVQTKDE